MKYTHKFNSNLTCTVELLDRPPEAGENHVIKTEWSQKPKKKHTLEYMRWMHVVNDNYAKEHGLRIMHIYQLGPRYNDWQIWNYGPDFPPVRLVMPDIQGGPRDIDALNRSLASDVIKATGGFAFTLDHQTQ